MRRGEWRHGAAAADQFVAGLTTQYGRAEFTSPTDHYFALNSLIPSAAKPAILQDWAWQQAGRDEPMWETYEQQFTALRDLPTDQQETRVLHRTNLESLLSRLDSATMQAGLEARVPFTDHHLVESMFRVPTNHKISVDVREPQPYLTSAQLAARGTLLSKRLLRTVAARAMPAELAQRKKASFPTPVQQWLSDPWADWAAATLRSSLFAQAVFQPQALEELTSNVRQAGMWLWPLINLTIWGDQEFD